MDITANATDTLKVVSDKLGDLLPTDAFLRGAQTIIDDQRRIVSKYGIEDVRRRQYDDALEALADLAEALGRIEAMTQLFPREAV